MKKVLQYLSAYKRESILGPVFKLLEATFELLVPLVVAAMIDQAIPSHNKSLALKFGGILVLLALVGFACSITAQYFAAKAAVGTTQSLRKATFSKILSLDPALADSIGTSTLTSRMTSDMAQVQTGINLTLRLLLRSPFVVFGAVIMAFTVDVTSAWIFVVIVPLMAAVVCSVMAFSIPQLKIAQKKMDKVLQALRDNFMGVRVIRAFSKEDAEKREFASKTHDAMRAYIKSSRISSIMNPATYVLVNGGIILLIYVGGIRVDHGVLKAGQVIALNNYMTQILVELIKLTNLVMTITKSIASAHRIQEILDLPSEEKGQDLSAAPSESPILVANHLSYIYEGASMPALEDVSFQAYPGETIGIIGGTGAGKSTLVHILCGLLRQSEGQLSLFGQDTSSAPLASIRSVATIIPQKPTLFRGSIRSNLEWGMATAHDDDMMEAAKKAQALDVIESKGGLDGIVEQGGRNLSGGQKQRLTIARGLLRKTPILILDDSASALDYATESKLRHALAHLSPKPLLFLVSQRTSSIMHADKILVLDDGRLVGCAPHDTLLQTCPIYKEIFDSQFNQEGVNA